MFGVMSFLCKYVTFKDVSKKTVKNCKKWSEVKNGRQDLTVQGLMKAVD